MDFFPPAVLLRFTGGGELGGKLSLDTWDGVAAWYSRLTADRVEPDKHIVRIAEEKGIAGQAPEEAVRAAYRYAKGEIRYVAVELGIGRFEPRKAKSTAEALYGDCKDKSTLLISLLRSQGIDADYVLVRTDNVRPFPENLPSLRFDHCIASVTLGGERVFMDPTCEECPFGYLPPGDQGAFALIIDGERGIPVKLPRTASSENVLLDEITLELNADGGAAFRHKRTCTGYYGVWLKSFVEDSEDKKNNELEPIRYFERIYRTEAEVDLTNVQIRGRDADADTVTLAAEGVLSEFAQYAGDYLILDPNITSVVMGVPPENADRKTSFGLGDPRTWRKVIAVEIPEGWVPVLKDDAGVDLEADYLSYRQRRELSGSTVIIRTELEGLKRAVAPEQYTEMRELMRKVVDNEKRELVCTRNP